MQRPAKSVAIERISKLIDQIPSLKSQEYDSPNFVRWKTNVEVAIRNTFVDSAEKLQSFNSIWYVSTLGDDNYNQSAHIRQLDMADARLSSVLDEIREYWEDDQAVVSQQTTQPELVPVTNEVFIIHGHDHGTKDMVARFLLGLDLKPIILHEQPNQGRTIIEKFEDYSQTSYAIVLLTPDDLGGPNADELEPRARQNVILEMGFFWGSLGRGRVAALLKGNLRVPSDYDGVLYIQIDDNYHWQLMLARELRSAGFAVDLNNLA